MKPEATFEFSDKDGIFYEEKYVKVLTSICPGIVSILYQTLQLYANEKSVMPLSKVYFKWKITNFISQSTDTTTKPLVSDVTEEQEQIQENVERIGNSDICIFKDSYITDNVKRGFFRRPSTPVAIKTRQMTPTEWDNFYTRQSAWSDIWLVGSKQRSRFLLSVYSTVEQNMVLHIAMEVASSSLYLEMTQGIITLPKDVNRVIFYMHNITEAINWLHKKSLPHGKITAKNIFIVDLGNNGKIAKLGTSDPCNFRAMSDREEDITLLGKLFKFSFFGEGDCIRLNSSHMYVANNLVKWLTQDSNKPMTYQVLDHPLFWDDEKSLQFICEFNNVLRSTMIKWEANMINPKSSTYFYGETSKDLYKWVEKVDSRLIEGYTGKIDKSFPSLLELIEKIVMLQSEKLETLKIDDNVIKELFYGESNKFCGKRLFDYFTERFPEVLILCFCATVKFQLNSWPLLHKYVGELREKKFDKIPTVIE